MDIQKDEGFEKTWQENRHIWESTKNLAKAMFYAGQAKAQAIPEGFVVLKISEVREVLSNASDAMCDEVASIFFNETGIPSTWYDHHLIAEKNILDAIEAQEPAK